MKEKLLQLAKVPKRSSLYGFLVLSLFFIFSFTTEVVGQKVTINGTVKNEAGEGIPGVTILVKGTTTGTITDMNGSFIQEVSGPEAVLQISSVGFKTQEVAVGNQTQFEIILVEDVQALGEVVVVGYGVQKRSDLTGATSSIAAKELQELPLARADQALQGRTSGVYVLNTDAAPGGETLIRIRGLNSINGGNEPLIVIDGLQTGMSMFRALNPNDIESMEVLKDASATAIYGSRGANGVILITTRQGKMGKPVIDVSVNVGFQNLANKLDVMDAVTYAEYQNLVRSKDTGGGNTPEPIFSPDDIAYYRENGGTDWQDVIYETGVIQNYQIGVSGATEKLKYMVSTNYLDHKGILKGSAYDRISLRSNLSADISKVVDFGLNFAFTKETYKSPDFRGEGVAFVAQAINVAPRWAPTEPVYSYSGDGSYHRHGEQRDGTVNTSYGPSDTWNPLASAIEPTMDRPTYITNANLYLNFNIVKGLSLKITGGGIFRLSERRDYYNLETMGGFANNGEAYLSSATFE